MYTFDDFLIESQMSYQEAARILGLSGDITPETVKKAYRKASMRAHPDRGGSDAEMQRINAAYRVLKDTKRVANQDKEDKKAEARAMAMSMLERFDFGTYNAHLSKLFGVNLKTRDKIHDSYYGVSRNVEFASDDRETVIVVRFGFIFSSFMRAKSLGGGDDQGDLMPGDVSISLEILHNRQKMKVKQRDYDVTRSTEVFDNPNVVFPADKIKKKIDIQDDSDQTTSKSGFQYASKAKKMKKRDFITTLAHKFPDGKMVKGDVFQIKGNGMTIQANRHTMMRQGFWQLNVFPRGTVDEFMRMIPESDVGLDIMLNVIGEMMMTKRPELTWKRYKGYLDEMAENGTFSGI